MRTSGGRLARREPRRVLRGGVVLNGYLSCPERRLRNSGIELGFLGDWYGCYPEAVMRGSTLNSNSYNPAFDPETTAAMATALEQVCKALRIKGKPTRAAGHRTRIIELARRGGRDEGKSATEY